MALKVTITVFVKSPAKSCLYKKIEEGSCSRMDQDIDQMVAEHIGLVKVIVQSEAEMRHATIPAEQLSHVLY